MLQMSPKLGFDLLLCIESISDGIFVHLSTLSSFLPYCYSPSGNLFPDHALLVFDTAVHGEIGEGDGALAVRIFISLCLYSVDDRIQSAQFDHFVTRVFAVLEQVSQNSWIRKNSLTYCSLITL